MEISGEADDERKRQRQKTSAGLQRGGVVIEADSREGLASGGSALPEEDPLEQPIRQHVRAATAGGKEFGISCRHRDSDSIIHRRAIIFNIQIQWGLAPDKMIGPSFSMAFVATPMRFCAGGVFEPRSAATRSSHVTPVTEPDRRVENLGTTTTFDRCGGGGLRHKFE